MTLMLLPDPDKTGSQESQEFPDHGVVVPCKVADTDHTKAEWEALIKKGLPLIVKDVKAAPAADEQEE